MKCSVLLLVLFLSLAFGEARRHRKTSKHSTGSLSRASRINDGNDLDSRNDAPSSINDSIVSGQNLAQVRSSLTQQREHQSVPTIVANTKRKSKRNRKGKKSRKSRKRNQNSLDKQAIASTKSILTISDETQKELLRSTMRHMFGFDHMTTPRASFDISKNKDAPLARTSNTEIQEERTASLDQMSNDAVHRNMPTPPDFMLELYRTYAEDRNLMVLNSQFQGNTIRSFFSVAGETPSRPQDRESPMIIIPYFKTNVQQADSRGASATKSPLNRQRMRVFAFNVTSIPAVEGIVGAELRLDGLRNAANNFRSQNVSLARWSAHISVYKVANEENITKNIYQRVGHLVTIRPTSSFTWVDSHIARLATRARLQKHILIVKFNQNEDDLLSRRRRSASANLYNPDLSNLRLENNNLDLPDYFMVVGTDRRKRNSGITHNHRPLVSSLSSLSLTPILVVYCNDTKTIVSKPTAPASDRIWNTFENVSTPVESTRTKRSASRRLPDEPALSAGDEIDNEFPGERRHDYDDSEEATRTHTREDNDQTELHDGGRAERRVIQQLKDRKTLALSKKGNKRKSRRRCKKRGKKSRKSRRCKKDQSSATPEPALNRAQQICSRKSLHVDFGDIGWADWIISPKSFDSYYCAGLCELNTMKKAGPSNHAIIQAAIKSFGLNPEVPAPCCVPEKLSSLSILYFDKYDNVVLKLYPDMSVETCSCR